jgi:hypothetical protein
MAPTDRDPQRESSGARNSVAAVTHEVAHEHAHELGGLPPPPKGKAGAVILAVWAACMLLLGAIMMGRHELSLPVPPPADPALAESLSALKDDPTHPLVVHVLYTQCRCSQKIAAHLAGSTRPVGMKETVLLIGTDEPLADRLRSRGFGVTSITDEELGGRFHLRSAPMLVVLGKGKEVRYVGGYTRTKQGIDPQDLEIIEHAQTEVVEPLPVLGCAVEKQLRARIDPTGLL